ncbi:MAG: rod shape-determining protein MreC, partial [Actinobacteria bacterium]|nr:rod shape-determining protein MreC [Actinomycetota bacterium]
RPRRLALTLSVLIALSITLVTLSARGGNSMASGVSNVARDVTKPFASGINAVLAPVGRFFVGAVRYGAVNDENARLQAALGRIKQDQQSRAFRDQQLRELMALGHLPFLSSLPTVVAQSTMIDVSNFASTITIDKGRSQGVTVGMPVVASGGLVGQVVEASRFSSIVRLITDGSSRVGVATPKGKLISLVVGHGATKQLTVEGIASTSSVFKNQKFFTSGLEGGIFPRGIPVGTVEQASSPTGSLNQTIVLRPAADLSQLTYVDVVLWEPRP